MRGLPYINCIRNRNIRSEFDASTFGTLERRLQRRQGRHGGSSRSRRAVACRRGSKHVRRTH